MFFKKKTVVAKQEEIPVENHDELMSQVQDLIVQLDGSEGDTRIALLDQIGICCFKAKEYDQAETYLEQSLQMKKATGDGYRTLLNLYNLRRREAASSKNDEKLQYYLRKIDEMMAISKEVLRSNL